MQNASMGLQSVRVILGKLLYHKEGVRFGIRINKVDYFQAESDMKAIPWHGSTQSSREHIQGNTNVSPRHGL